MTTSFKLDDTKNQVSMGLIVLQTDETIENEFRSILGKNFKLYHSRIPSHQKVTPKNLLLMEKELPIATKLLPRNLNCIGYACTSGATIIGPSKIEKIINKIFPDTHITNPISSVVDGLNYLDAKNIAFISPYINSVSNEIRGFLVREGFNITSLISYEQEDESIVARIKEEDTLEYILDIPKNSYDAVFISCTNLRTFNIINYVEKKLNKPVISSNLALAWNMIRLSGISMDDPYTKIFSSKLFEKH